MRSRLTVWPFVGVLACVVLASPPAGAKVNERSADSRPTYTMIMITGDETLPADPYVFARVFEHAGDVCQPAEAAGYDCSFAPVGSATAEPPSATQRSRSIICYLGLTPRGPEATGDRKEITAAVVKRLQTFLAKLNQPRLNAIASQLQQTQRRLDECQNEIGRLVVEQEDYSRALVELGGGILAEGLDQQRRELVGQGIMLNVEVEGLKARRQAVLKHLAEAEKELAKQREEPDMELRKLEAMLKVQYADLTRLNELNKRTPGTVSSRDIEHARLAVEKVQCDIEARRQARDRQEQNEALAGLNHQLADVEIETAAMETKQSIIDAMLKSRKPDEIRRLDQKIELTRNRLRQLLDRQAAAERQLAELSDRIRAFRMPEIMVLDDVKTGPAGAKKEPAGDTPAKR